MIAIGQPSFKRVHIYIQTGNTWSRLLTLNGDRPSGQYLIELGKIVSVSDKYVSVSSTGIETVGLPIEITEQNRIAGVVSLYRRVENDLHDIYNPDPNVTAFGYSTDIYNDTLIVGANDTPTELVTIDGVIRTNRPQPGAAYIYALNGSHPTLVQTIPNPEPTLYRFGHDVKIYDTFAAITAQGSDYTVNGFLETRGKVFIYKLIDNVWAPHSVLSDPVNTNNTVFGYSIALKGTTLAISAYGTNTDTVTKAGAVYIYKLQNDQWILDATIRNPRPFEDADFGDNINLDGDTLTVNSYMNPVDAASGTGTLFIYNRKNGTWSLTAEINNPLLEQWGSFGYRSSLYANHIAAGDLNNNAYIYRLGPPIAAQDVQTVS